MPRPRTVGINCKNKQRSSILVNGEYKQIFIETNKNHPLWDLFKSYINRLAIGQEFTRKDLLEAVYTKDSSISMRRQPSSVDQYRNSCKHIGFIKSVSVGKYKKLFDIPDNLTTSLLAKHVSLYSKRTWREWAMPYDSRIKYIYRACENVESS